MYQTNRYLSKIVYFLIKSQKSKLLVVIVIVLTLFTNQWTGIRFFCHWFDKQIDRASISYENIPTDADFCFRDFSKEISPISLHLSKSLAISASDLQTVLCHFQQVLNGNLVFSLFRSKIVLILKAIPKGINFRCFSGRISAHNDYCCNQDQQQRFHDHFDRYSSETDIT